MINTRPFLDPHRLHRIPSALPWVMAIGLSSLVAACGGGGQDPILGAGNMAPVETVVPAVPPATALAITAVMPLPNTAGLALNTKTITATFNKPMDVAALNTSSFTLACPSAAPISGGTVTYVAASQIATLTLPANTVLPANTLCTATVNTAAKDNTGLALANNFAWSFGTGAAPDTTAPTVTSTVNANGSSNIAVNTQVGATFSEAMNPLTISNTSVTVKQGTTVVPGTTAYSGVSLVFVPTSNLAPATTYTATINTGATDLAGNALTSDYVWSWTTSPAVATDTTAPTVTDTVNANGATNVAVNTQVGATFSEALNPLTVTNASFTLKQTVSGAAVAGTTRYAGTNAVFTPSASLPAGTQYTATLKGGATGIEDLAANAMAADYTWSWTTAAAADTTAPLVSVVFPADMATNVPVASAVNATFNEAMDPLTINSANFKVTGVTGVVSFNAQTRVATFTPNTPLIAGTTYTTTVTRGVSDLAGNNLASDKVWTFSTAALPVVVVVAVPLNAAAPFGTFGGTAGMTNMGTLTQINGDIGTTATGTSMVTGFHDTLGDIYTETLSNMGSVNGKIYTCTNSTTGPTSAGVNAPACAVATQARLDAQAAYLALVAKPVGGASPAPGANLASITLLPGTYKSASGSFMIQGGNLTLDAQGDANATWVFQMATTLTVGGPGAAFPQSIILAGGAQAKNVFWQVGSFATINAAGGGTMAGTIIAQGGASFSTAGNVSTVTLNGRVLSLGASVTLVNTVINVP